MDKPRVDAIRPAENEQESKRTIAAPADFKRIATVDDFAERMHKTIEFREMVKTSLVGASFVDSILNQK